MKRAAFAALLFFPAMAATQVPGDISAGVFSEVQAERGADLYAARCASCHLPDLRGDTHSPALVGIGFAFVWGGRPLAELYVKISREMPPEQPGGLSPSNYADIVAFILRANDYPAGDTDLPGDKEALADTTIPAF